MTTATDWQAQVGDVWAEQRHRTDRSLADLSRHLDAAIADNSTDRRRILDIGCGGGATTLTVARTRPDALVLGVDLSPRLIEVAEARLSLGRLSLAQVRSDPHGLTALPDPGEPTFEVGDALDVAERRGPFDLLISRHGVMFFADPVQAFTRLRAAAAPGATLVFSCFRARALNPWAGDLVVEVAGQRPADPSGYAPGPFAFADERWTADMLINAGWTAPTASAIDFTYVAGGGDDPIADAVDFLTRIGPLASAIAAAPDPASLRARLAMVLVAYSTDTHVQFPAAAWIWVAQAGNTP